MASHLTHAGTLFPEVLTDKVWSGPSTSVSQKPLVHAKAPMSKWPTPVSTGLEGPSSELQRLKALQRGLSPAQGGAKHGYRTRPASTAPQQARGEAPRCSQGWETGSG